MTRLKFAELTWAPGHWLGVGLGALFPAWSQLGRMEDRSCQLALF